MGSPVKHPWEEKTFHNGMKRDSEDEFISGGDGFAVDACNTITSKASGNFNSREKIKGEIVLYSNLDNRCIGGTGLPITGSYTSIGSESVSGKKIEFFANDNGTGPHIIRIDGKIVCMTSLLPFKKDKPLQMAKDETCQGGEIYITDFDAPPMFFNLGDLNKNSGVGDDSQCTQKYFEDFNISEHYLILQQTMNVPIFIGLSTNVGTFDYVFQPDTDPGLPPGYYSYSIQYVTTTGEITARSMSTPQIPVVRRVDSRATTFPWMFTHGGSANSGETQYGIHLRLRIDNSLNYDFIKIIRTRWNSEDPINIPPTSEVCGLIDLVDGQKGIVNFLDLNGFEETLGNEEESEVMAAIKRAKAIRYFQRRLYLMNIEYASRVVTDNDYTINPGDVISPTIEKLGKPGHSDPYRATYFKHNRTQEKYGYGIIFWDHSGNYTFVDEVEQSFEFPSRRSSADQETIDTSYRGLVTAGRENGSIGYCHEVFDLLDAERKPDSCEFFNILNKGSKSGTAVEISGYDCDIPDEYQNSLGYVTGEKLGFRPFRPVNHSDTGVTGAEFRPNTGVLNDSDIGNPYINYDPKGFAPNYYAMGASFKGLLNWPAWASGFSIVRTKPANRVECQGIAHYALNKAGGTIGIGASKETHKIWVYIPDATTGLTVDPEIYNKIVNNSGEYVIQAVSPLGFFTEAHSMKRASVGGLTIGIDMITYARIIKEEIDGGVPQINPDDGTDIGKGHTDGDQYVMYGAWRRNESDPQTDGPFANFSGGDTEFNIVSITPQTGVNGRGNYLVVEVDKPIYWHGGTGGQSNGKNQDVRRWHEPLYIINFLRKNADVPDQNITTYVSTGHIQKFYSEIGVSGGELIQSYSLVDERWEDCVSYPTDVDASILASSPYLNLEKFIFVKDESGNEYRWLNVTSRSDSQREAILIGLSSDGYYDITDDSGTYRIYGIYRDSQSLEGQHRNFSIDFEVLFQDYPAFYQIPSHGSVIIVRYDNRMPSRVFGGDGWVNEAIWAPLDLSYNISTGGPSTDDDDFLFNIGFPNRKYNLNPRIFIVQNTQGLGGWIQDQTELMFDDTAGFNPAKIRQLVNMFCCESKTNLSFFFNDTGFASNNQAYPKVQYVMRPYKCNTDNQDDPAQFLQNNDIHPEYYDEYFNEWAFWNYGGYKFLPRSNKDYSKLFQDGRTLSSVPTFGFTEQNEFCSRIIWSLQRAVNIQNAPGVRTFPDANYYDISDNNGQIVKAWSALSGKGGHLYAFCDSGLSLLLVDTRMLSEVNGDEIATLGSEASGVLKDIWLSEEQGINDEMWRGFAEVDNVCYFPNKNSVWMFVNNNLFDIGREGYFDLLISTLEAFSPGYTDHMTAIFDQKNEVYMLTLKRMAGSRWTELTSVFVKTMYIIDDEAYGNIPQDNYDAITNDLEVGPGTIINLYTETALDEQVGVILGSPMGIHLNSEVIICVESWSTYGIKVVYRDREDDADVLKTETILPGTCQKFTPYYLDYNQGAYYNPFDKDAVYFTGVGFNPNNEVEQFVGDGCQTFMFRPNQDISVATGQRRSIGNWQGRSAHDYETYMRNGSKVYGVRNLTTYELNSGYTLNGSPIIYELLASAAPEPTWDKEFIRIRVNSDKKPTSIKFYLSIEDALDDNELCSVTGTTIKSRYGYECFIPRAEVERHRMQGRLLYYRIIHNLAESFKVVSSMIQYKKLK
jgi:hypothetical protein